MQTLLEPLLQKEFLKNIFSWFQNHGRQDMAWRKTRDPYAIMVSEFMLQQTTVGTVKPYFDRFLGKFPTLETLAGGELNEVLALWSGLGYYARGRNLWAAAREITAKHAGRIPREFEKLQKLPGVGPYIAGALSTIAFNEPAPVLDGNITRVMLRILAIEDDVKLKAVQVILRKAAFDLSVQAKRLEERFKTLEKMGGPRSLSLALMDLGATVCLPRNPACEICPVAIHCLARRFGRQNSIPIPGEKAERPTVRRLYAVISRKGAWLMGQRPKEGLFGGLWEFPGFDVPSGEEPIPFLERGVFKETGVPIRVKESVTAFEHQLTHRIYAVRPFIAEISHRAGRWRLKAKGEIYEKFRWIAPAAISRHGISAITKRILAESKVEPGD